MRKRRAFEIQSRIELTGISKLRENGLSIVPERIYLSLSLFGYITKNIDSGRGEAAGESVDTYRRRYSEYGMTRFNELPFFAAIKFWRFSHSPIRYQWDS